MAGGGRRRYLQSSRAAQTAETHRRIVEAAVELHNTVGPARTTDLAMAERAGVTPRTFYRHFPTDLELFRACMAHGVERWPPPDPSPWREIRDPLERLRVGLTALYLYYREAGRGLAVVIRDNPLLRPELRALPGRGQLLRAIPDVLLEGWEPKTAGRRRSLAAAVGLATSVAAWQWLVDQQGLTDEEAVGILVAMVAAVAGS
jgi:AcrR family transcriptional regulator